MRDEIRKKFTTFYAKENLFDTNSFQKAENQRIDEITNFGTVSFHIHYSCYVNTQFLFYLSIGM